MVYRARDDLLSSILTEEQAEELIELKKAGTQIQELADRYGVHRNTVNNIWRRHLAREKRKGNNASN